MAEIRVVIADDHAVLRDGLRSLIDGQTDMAVVGEAEDAKAVVERCLQVNADVVVLDLAMPEGGGIAATRKLRGLCPETRVLVLTMYDDAVHLSAVLEAGAAGYVAKRLAATDLLDAIREVHGGRSYVRASLPQASLRGGVAPPERSGAALSRREQEVLVLLARGHSNREVAERLGIAKKSIDTYRLRLQEKLNLRGRASLVRYAMAAGLLTRPSETPPDPGKQTRVDPARRK